MQSNKLFLSIFFGIIAVLFLVYLFLPKEPTPQPTKTVELTVHKTTTTEPQNDPAKTSYTKIQREMMGYTSPGQEEMNAMLKQLYIAKEQFPESGDLRNIIGRIYLYKLNLEKQESLVSKEWIESWKKEMMSHFSEAKQLYSKNFITSFNFPVRPWMPESKLYSVRKVEYALQKDALEDLDKIANFAKNFSLEGAK